MKILYVNIPTGTEASEFGDFAKNSYVPLMKKNISLVKSPDTEIVFRFCEWGMGPIDMAFYRYIDHLASRMVYYSARNAKEEGFDAVIVNCFGDPMLWELRQALDIPVVGIGESSMLYATLMGYKFGIVHISPYNIPETEEHIVKYGLKDRCIGLRPIDSWNAGLEEGLTLSKQTVAAFVSTARKLISDGAEVIIPGCSLMSPTMRLTPGAEDLYPDGLTRVDDVPVVDVLSVTLKMAESMAALYRAGSGWISRKLLFAQPPEYVKDMSVTVTENYNFKFWDIAY